MPTQNAQQQVIAPGYEEPLAIQLDANLLRAYGEWKDAPAERILNAMLEHIAAADSISAAELKGAHVRLLATATPLVAPGLNKTIYISRGALSTVVYENELAYLLAVQLACVRDHVTAHNLTSLRGQEASESPIKLAAAPTVLRKSYMDKGWFDAGGLFDFGSVAYLKAGQDGVKLMYSAKYDPRGAVTLVQRWTTPPVEEQMGALGKILPEPEERLDSAREEVAKLSPLHDPIVKSRAFEELQSRLTIKKAKTRKTSK